MALLLGTAQGLNFRKGPKTTLTVGLGRKTVNVDGFLLEMNSLKSGETLVFIDKSADNSAAYIIKDVNPGQIKNLGKLPRWAAEKINESKSVNIISPLFKYTQDRRRVCMYSLNVAMRRHSIFLLSLIANSGTSGSKNKVDIYLDNPSIPRFIIIEPEYSGEYYGYPFDNYQISFGGREFQIAIRFLEDNMVMTRFNIADTSGMVNKIANICLDLTFEATQYYGYEEEYVFETPILNVEMAMKVLQENSDLDPGDIISNVFSHAEYNLSWAKFVDYVLGTDEKDEERWNELLWDNETMLKFWAYAVVYGFEILTTLNVTGYFDKFIKNVRNLLESHKLVQEE